MAASSPTARALRVLWAVGLGAIVVFAALVVLGPDHAASPLGHALYVLVYLVGGAILALRAATAPDERGPWAVLAAAMGAFAVAWALYFGVVARLDAPPYPSVSDAFWISGYLGYLLGVLLLARSARRISERGLWADGLAAALAISAVAAAFLVKPIVASTGASVAAVVTNLAYPLLDLLLVTVVLVACARAGWRPGRRFAALGLIFGLEAAADAVYLHQAATGSYLPGGPLDLAWPLVTLAIARVAWWPVEPAPVATDERSGLSAAVPLAAAAIAVGLTAVEQVHEVGPAADVLAMATLLVALARAGTALADARTLQRTRELAASNELILGSAGEGIYGLDAQGRIVFANAAAAGMTGHEERELVGRPAHALIHHHRADGTPYPALACPVVRTLQTGERHGGSDEHYWRKDGTSFPVEYTSTPMLRDGQVAGAVVVFRDITERRAIDRMKDEFTSVVSHELRTPLTSIRGSLGLVAGGALGELPAPAQRMVGIAVANTDRLVRLINDILDVERLESGRVGMERRACSAPELVAQAVQVVQATADDAGVRLTGSAADAELLADPDRIVQALTNLLGNAIKFSPRGATVLLTCERSGPAEVTFAVVDQGRGIPPEKLETVFERFGQVDGTDAREKGGTGLGLSISRSIVEQHDGRLWVESTVGEGSTFRVALPAEPCARPASSSTPTSWCSTSGCRARTASPPSRSRAVAAAGSRSWSTRVATWTRTTVDGWTSGGGPEVLTKAVPSPAAFERHVVEPVAPVTEGRP